MIGKNHFFNQNEMSSPYHNMLFSNNKNKIEINKAIIRKQGFWSFGPLPRHFLPLPHLFTLYITANEHKYRGFGQTYLDCTISFLPSQPYVLLQNGPNEVNY